jgi:hypothetical protein
MTDADLLKYKKSLEKIVTESTIFGLAKIPNICDKYMERLIKFYSTIMQYSIKKEKDPKKCVKNVKKIEKSPAYIDLLENCLIPKSKEVDKIFKKYPNRGKKIIALSKKMISILEKKIQKMNNEKKIEASMVLINLNAMKEKLKILTSENERFVTFLNKNKKELAELKKKDIKGYISFYIIRYPLGCLVLP